MFKKFLSQFGSQDADEDISTMIGNTTREHLLRDVLPYELILIIGQYLPISDLNNLAQCDQFLLNLFFNLTPQKVNMIAKRKKELASQSMESRIVSIKDHYKDDELNQSVQTLIWKPLVLYHFPHYSRTLNIKNWMHVMRRRVIHLKNKHPLELPLSKIIIEKASSHGTLRKNKDQFIENCEWEYECPLKKNVFRNANVGNASYCKVCKENVYEVTTVNQFKYHVEQGHCVAFSQYLVTNPYPQRIGKIRYIPPTN